MKKKKGLGLVMAAAEVAVRDGSQWDVVKVGELLPLWRSLPEFREGGGGGWQQRRHGLHRSQMRRGAAVGEHTRLKMQGNTRRRVKKGWPYVLEANHMAGPVLCNNVELFLSFMLTGYVM